MYKKFLILLIMLVAMPYSVKGGEAAKSREYIFTYDVTLNNVPSRAKEIEIWIPYPAENTHQEVVDVSSQGARRYYKGKDRFYGNNILYCSIRSPKEKVIHLQKTYKIKRREFFNRLYVPSGYSLPCDNVPDSQLSIYTKENNFVIITEQVRQLASKLTKGKDTDIEKARAFYDYLFENLTYDKTEPGWGEGDIKRVCLSKKGNCTDFHSYFIALCLAAEIPAKFVIGVPLPKTEKSLINSYHCWAEFYDPGRGWIPVDISEAWKNKSRFEYYFGSIDENRIEFTHGRDIVLVPPQNKEPLNYFIFPYVEIDGEKYTDIVTAFYCEGIQGKRKEAREGIFIAAGLSGSGQPPGM